MLTFRRILAKFNSDRAQVMIVNVARSVSVEQLKDDTERLKIVIGRHLSIVVASGTCSTTDKARLIFVADDRVISHELRLIVIPQTIALACLTEISGEHLIVVVA